MWLHMFKSGFLHPFPIEKIHHISFVGEIFSIFPLCTDWFLVTFVLYHVLCNNLEQCYPAEIEYEACRRFKFENSHIKRSKKKWVKLSFDIFYLTQHTQSIIISIYIIIKIWSRYFTSFPYKVFEVQCAYFI